MIQTRSNNSRKRVQTTAGVDVTRKSKIRDRWMEGIQDAVTEIQWEDRLRKVQKHRCTFTESSPETGFPLGYNRLKSFYVNHIVHCLCRRTQSTLPDPDESVVVLLGINILQMTCWTHEEASTLLRVSCVPSHKCACRYTSSWLTVRVLNTSLKFTLEQRIFFTTVTWKWNS
jgi:hypothetical protein